MSRYGRNTVSALRLLAAAVFYILRILLFPISLLAYVMWSGKEVLTGRASGVSRTAQGPLFRRWLQHKLGVRQDEPTHRLIMAMPVIPRLGMELASIPILLAHRLTGYVPRTFRYPFEGDISIQHEGSARVEFFDNAVERYLGDITQFVILGAGFDTRAFRLSKNTPIQSFEVDTPETQAIKRNMLEKAGIDAARVKFVSAHIEKDDWFRRLLEAGFDNGRPALFLWEGVSMYLDRATVETTLRKIAGSAKGSFLVFDYLTTEPFESQALYWNYLRTVTRVVGEPLKFGIDSTPPSRERLIELLQSCGLSLAEQRTLGQENGKKRAWGGFAIAIVDETI